MNITISKEKALEALETNLSAHQVEYQDQLIGWQEHMEKYGIALSEWAVKGGTGHRPIQPSKPQKYDREYKRLIKMLHLHHGDLTIEDHDFDRIFLDKFNWKHNFHTNSSLYASGYQQPQDDEDDEEFDF